jgi:hypothetical protein
MGIYKKKSLSCMILSASALLLWYSFYEKGLSQLSCWTTLHTYSIIYPYKFSNVY